MWHVKAFTFNPVQENSYVLYNEQHKCVIIDPGCYFPEERQELKDFILQTGLEPVWLLNTHCHLDHVFGNKFVAETWGLRLHIHPEEEKVLAFAPTSGEMWQLPFENYTGELVFLQEGDFIEVGEDRLSVLLTPGHSPGSLSFYAEKEGFVIGGDVLFNGSVGRTDLPGGSFTTLFQSIQTKLFVLPDDTKVYSGHGPVTTIGFEKMNNPYVKLF
ncbi:MAG: MBL fold metallo-hydrolase [Chitinophagaceae bacterium]|nr:MBL fold metallo-hydrolase [Chitinophagaceae bacterium]